MLPESGGMQGIMKNINQGGSPNGGASDAGPSISSDRPVKSLEADKYELKRDFIPRLARLALDWPSEDGLVIGLFGSWGIGKTSILNMFRDYVRQNKAKYSNMLVASFNPWFYEDTGALIASFFATISVELGKHPDTRVSQAAKTLKAMGAFLTVASKGISLFGFNLDAGIIKEGVKAGQEVLAGVGEFSGELAGLVDKGQKNLDDHRETVERALNSLGGDKKGRLVILVDDVDRLNKAELLTLLRLIRTVADLPYITLVVAMDEERVRDVLEKAVSEGYGQGFLDKIIQVPLHVPLPERGTMTAELVAQLKASFDALGLPFPEELASTQFHIPKELGVLVSLVKTPRDLSRFINGVRTLLLAGTDPDVHPTDAALIEALRIFYPDVYDRVRRYKSFLTDESRFAYFGGGSGRDREKERGKRSEELDLLVRGGTSVLEPKKEESIRSIIGFLFGDPTDTNSHRERRRDTANRRIRTPEFFDNYFRYASPPGVVKRQEVIKTLNDILSHAKRGSDVGIAGVLAAALRDRGGAARDQMVQDLGHEIRSITPDLLEVIAQGVLSVRIQLPEEIVYRLLRNILDAAANSRYANMWERPKEDALGSPFRIFRLILEARLELSALYMLMEDLKGWVSDNKLQNIAGEVLCLTEQALIAGDLFRDKEQIPAQVSEILVPALHLSIKLGSSATVPVHVLQSRFVDFVRSHAKVLPQVLSSISPGGRSLRGERGDDNLKFVFGDYKQLHPVYEQLHASGVDNEPDRQALERFGEILSSPHRGEAKLPEPQEDSGPSSDDSQ